MPSVSVATSLSRSARNARPTLDPARFWAVHTASTAVPRTSQNFWVSESRGKPNSEGASTYMPSAPPVQTSIWRIASVTTTPNARVAMAM